MHHLIKLLFLLVFLGAGSCSAGNARQTALFGSWKCGPYTVASKGFDMTAVENSTYSIDGSYRATSELTVRLANGRVVRTRDRSVGNWTLKSNIIEIHYSKVEFLSSDDPTYTIQMGQADTDAQQKKKNWTKYKVLELGDKLITLPVQSMYKAAEVAITCIRI